MGRYILRRILQAIPLLAIVSVLVFFLLKTAGDPLAYLAEDPTVTEADRALIRAQLGLNEPVFPHQFVTWLIGDDWRMRDFTGDGVPDDYGTQRGILRGDFGESIRYQRSVSDVVSDFLPNTLLLGFSAYVLTIIFSLVIGMYAALRPYTLADNLLTGGAFVTYSMPIFLIALLLVQVFAIWLDVLPVQGMYDARAAARGIREPLDLARHMILPVLSIALISIAGYSRYVRSSMLEVINSDYIRTARAKGLPQRRVVSLHALKNAALPLVTLIGLDVPFILSGAIVTETIFGWPGMGQLFINSLNFLDAPVLIFIVLMTAIAVVLMQLLTDIAYATLDPRVRYS
ncbi:MAG: ABC transporter permease [Chloroflexi bacterium]|nr:ABC transporter permease [Chloroflexota bacterium]